MRHLALVFAVSLGASCATSSSSGASPASSGASPASSADADSLKAQKDRTACLKMCELAGAAEDKGDEVAACQARCPAGADTGATAP